MHESRQKNHRKRALQSVNHEHEYSKLPAQHAKHVRRSQISGAVLSQVDSLRPAGQVSRWERAREIGQRERDRGMHSVLAPENDPERVAQETESRTEAVMQEANIVLLHECWLASENHDHRR